MVNYSLYVRGFQRIVLMCQRNYIPKFIFAALLLLSAVESSALEYPTLSLRLATDAIYQGVSETNGKPILAVNGEYALTSNIIVGAQLRKVIVNNSLPRDGNFSTYIGYDKAIGKNWLSSTYIIHRKFPQAQIDWDFTQVSTRLSNINGLSFDISYSPNYYSASVKGIGTKAQYTKDVSKHWYWRAQLGNFNIPSLLNYQHADLSIGLRFQQINIELSYHWTSDTELRTRVGSIQSPNALLSITYAAF